MTTLMIRNTIYEEKAIQLTVALVGLCAIAALSATQQENREAGENANYAT